MSNGSNNPLNLELLGPDEEDKLPDWITPVHEAAMFKSLALVQGHKGFWPSDRILRVVREMVGEWAFELEIVSKDRPYSLLLARYDGGSANSAGWQGKWHLPGAWFRPMRHETEEGLVTDIIRREVNRDARFEILSFDSAPPYLWKRGEHMESPLWQPLSRYARVGLLSEVQETAGLRWFDWASRPADEEMIGGSHRRRITQILDRNNVREWDQSYH